MKELVATHDALLGISFREIGLKSFRTTKQPNSKSPYIKGQEYREATCKIRKICTK